MKHKNLLIAIGICVIAFFAIALTVFFQIGYNCGYSEGKNHVIYTQEVYTDAEGFSVVIDGECHSYK